MNKNNPLNKFLAHAGLCSRRNATDLIKLGLIKVNGKTQKNPASQVTASDKVTYKGKLVRPEKKLYILLNKPKGFVSTVSDEKGRKTVLDLLGNKVKVRLYPVGRLDITTTGLMLLTNDGELAQKLAHPRYEVEKEYAVTLHKSLLEKDRKELLKGVRLPRSKETVKADAISRAYGPQKNLVRVAIHSGKYRIIRRIFESLGYFVDRLDRIQFAGISKRGLPLGHWRFLTLKEQKKLKR